ncbi:zinc knuckle CX2CX4HX4C containing protein [Tanacetum coccineum]
MASGENLLKEDVSTVPVWIKLHGVPVTAFSGDGLSAIATKLGTPLMLDSYTSDMRMQSWEYRPVPKKYNASSSGNKKKGVEPTIEVSNSNPFDVLNSVDNNMEFSTNEGTTNLVNNRATSSGSSFMNIDNNGEFASNTPIGEKIDKIERQICEGKLRLLDDDGNPLVPTGYGTNSLLERWRDSYPDNDDYDPYDDDMYENHGFSEHLQSICDDLDITVCGMKKKYIF